MNNFSIKVNGKEYWISRSLAVAVFIFRKVGNKFQVLLEKRGKGAADNIGKWCCVVKRMKLKLLNGLILVHYMTKNT